MISHQRVIRIAGCCSTIALAVSAQAQLAPQDALARMRTADGFVVSLFASEPDLWNPTSMDVDAQGRVWIAEAVNYRLFNQERTTDLGDRIRVLEDTDGDGRCDKATTFYQHPSLQAPMGIAVLGDRVYVCQSPDVFYLEDTDGDGKADKRTVILTGFAGIDNDHAVHGVAWGPDNRLYFSNGDKGLDVTDKHGNRVHAGPGAPLMAGTVLRTDLEGDRLEWLAQGMRNPYEPTLDSFGNLFISDNDDDGNENTRINYVMEGGNYGYWPHRKGDLHLESVHWNMDQPGVVPRMIRTGFGSPCGMLTYEGRSMPERIWNALIHAEAGPGEIRAYYPRPDGAGFAADQEVLLRCENDSWFRPVDVAVAPDGSIFVADWYDPGVGGHRMGDVIRGRVYRLTDAATRSTGYKVPPLDLTSEAGFREALASPNVARRFLAYFAFEMHSTDFARSLLRDEDPMVRARALWPASGNPFLRHEGFEAASKNESVFERVQAVRAIARAHPAALLAYPQLLTDKSPQVRRQLLLELARAPYDVALPGKAILPNGAPGNANLPIGPPGNANLPIGALTQPSSGQTSNSQGLQTVGPREVDQALLDLAVQFDGSDRFYREAIGIAFRGREEWAWNELVSRLGADWNARLAGLAIQLHPPAVVDVAKAAANNDKLDIESRKLALKTLDATRDPEAGAAIAAQVTNTAPAELDAYALELLAFDGGDLWRAATDASSVDAYLRARFDNPSTREAARDFIGTARRGAFVPDLLRESLNSARTLDERIRAVQFAARMAIRENTPADLLSTLLDGDDGRLAVEALGILARFRDGAAIARLHAYVIDAKRDRGFRRNAARLLAESMPGAMMLLKSAEADALPIDIEFDVGEALRSCQFDDVRMLAGQVLPPETTRDGKPLPTVSELMALHGDATRGRAIFFSEDRSQCYQCHTIAGNGGHVGPDLSKIGEKYGKEGLLESILNPSAAIGHEYEVWVIETRANDVMTGYLRSDTPEGIELVESAGNLTPIPADDIADRYRSAMSLMPNGLAAGMTAQELADVVAYLESLK